MNQRTNISGFQPSSTKADYGLAGKSHPSPAKKDYWEVWFDQYYRTDKAFLAIHLIRVLLSRGFCNAEDGHCMPVERKNIRGAVMRDLDRMGIIEHSGFVKATTKQSHGRFIRSWRLVNRPVAQSIIDRFEGVVFRSKQPEPEHAFDDSNHMVMNF